VLVGNLEGSGKREEGSGEQSERFVIARRATDEPLTTFPASRFPLPASRYRSVRICWVMRISVCMDTKPAASGGVTRELIMIWNHDSVSKPRR